jgi:hypothetical protein
MCPYMQRREPGVNRIGFPEAELQRRSGIVGAVM